jgi:hypothetical protein
MKLGAIITSDFETAFKLIDRLPFTVASGSLPLRLLLPLRERERLRLRLGLSPIKSLISPLENEAVELFPTNETPTGLSDESPSPAFSTPWETAAAWADDVPEEVPAATSMSLDGCLSDDSPSPAFSTPWEAAAAWEGDVPEGGPAVASLPRDVCLSPASPSSAFSTPWETVAAWACWETVGAWAGDFEVVGPAVDVSTLKDFLSDEFMMRYSKNDE